MRDSGYEQYVLMNPGLTMIYGMVAARSEHDALLSVMSEPERVLFDGHCGTQPIEARRLDELDECTHYEVAPAGPVPHGHVGGDDQVGDSLSRRFARWIPTDNEWAVVEVYWYVADDSNTRKRRLERMHSYSTCTDLADIGGTETWGDNRYHTVKGWAAHESSLILAASWFDADTDIDWDEVA